MNDYDAIYDLVKIAFQTAEVSDAKEQDFVYTLRSANRHIPELELVAQEDGQLIGHIMLTKLPLHTKEGTHEVLLLAPLCVKLAYRNQNVGAALVQEGFRIARAFGYTCVFLAGNPAYYSRFGFQRSSTFGIQNTSGVPDEFSLACELSKGALDQLNGTVCLA